MYGICPNMYYENQPTEGKYITPIFIYKWPYKQVTGVITPINGVEKPYL